MGSIDRYILRTTLGAFLLILVSLTGMIWVTQALRDIDIITAQGQTILVFIGITLLIVPSLILMIAPMALVIAVAHVLNKLSTDSELIVMNAAGLSPWRLFRGFLTSALIVSLAMAVIGAIFAPMGLRELRRLLNEVRADVVSNVLQPGRFTAIERGLTVHIRERRSDGILLGILVDDRRDPKERSTFLAEQGEIVKSEQGTFLVLENGSVQRRTSDQRDPTLVLYDRYAFDLSRVGGGPVQMYYTAREMYPWELFAPEPYIAILGQQGQLRAEIHDRIAGPIYPFVFVVVTFAYLGMARTTRQSRAMSLVGAIVAIFLLRLIGFASVIFGSSVPAALFAQYVALAVALGLGLLAISRGIVIEPPAFLSNALGAINERVTRRVAAT